MDSLNFMHEAYYDLNYVPNNRNKDKNHLIISIDAGKSLQQDPTPLHDKSSKKTRNRRKVPQHCTASIILNGDKLKPFPLKSGDMGAHYPHSYST
jgi:hypothetical protein